MRQFKEILRKHIGENAQLDQLQLNDIDPELIKQILSLGSEEIVDDAGYDEYYDEEDEEDMDGENCDEDSQDEGSDGIYD